jgi:galactokinase
VGIDVRLPIGALFTIIGVVLACFGAASDKALYERSLGININLEWGLVMLGFGLVMLVLGHHRSRAEGKPSNATRNRSSAMKREKISFREADIVKAADLHESFLKTYGTKPRIYRAPGRVNLIGEHTDYNDGFVMPAAIELYVWVAIAPRKDGKLCVRSLNFDATAEMDLQASLPPPCGRWSDYLFGIVVMLMRSGDQLQGANLLVHGEVPMGAGLGSSAAIEVAAGLALLEASGQSLAPVELAKICQRAENEYVGARVGIMDQFVSCFGRAGAALMLDCRSLDYRILPLPPGVELVICNTMVKHGHASGEYNRRREQCEDGVRLLSQWLPHVRALRDVTPTELNHYSTRLPQDIYKRCRHVVTENVRVSNAAAALERGDLQTFGCLMHESHRSLREDYQVSCDELDLMVEIARKQPGVFGSRMTGGGFGGCTINLVDVGESSKFQQTVALEYQRVTGITPEILVSSAAVGASEVRE